MIRFGERLALFFGLFCFVITFSAQAQLPVGTILGVIKDSTGAILPGVELTVTNVNTGQLRTTVSSENGSYRVPALPVGNYEVRAVPSITIAPVVAPLLGIFPNPNAPGNVFTPS